MVHVSKTEPLLFLRLKLGWTPHDDEGWNLLDKILEAAPPPAEARAAASD